MLLGGAVDLLEVHVRKYLAAVFAEGSYLIALEILPTTAAVDFPRNSQMSSDGDSVGCTAEAVFFRRLGLDTT